MVFFEDQLSIFYEEYKNELIWDETLSNEDAARHFCQIFSDFFKKSKDIKNKITFYDFDKKEKVITVEAGNKIYELLNFTLQHNLWLTQIPWYPLISIGVAPRATIYLGKAAKSIEFSKNRAYVIPEDIREIGAAILRHRIITTYEADAEEITTDEIISKIFDAIPIP